MLMLIMQQTWTITENDAVKTEQLQNRLIQINGNVLFIDRNDNEVLGEQIDVLRPAFHLRVTSLLQTDAYTQQTHSNYCITTTYT